MVKKLKPHRNKCILCHSPGSSGLHVVTFLADRENILNIFKQYGSVTLCEDDTVCSNCLDIAQTVSQNIADLQKVCKGALDRQPVTVHGKRVHIQENFAENLSKNLTNMFEQGRLCNTSLISNDLKEYKVHSTILAANTNTLDEELEGSSNIGLKDVSEQGLKALIQYLYTGELVLSVNLAKQILPYCERWELEWAADRCNELIRDAGKLTKSPGKQGLKKPKKSVPTVMAAKVKTELEEGEIEMEDLPDDDNDPTSGSELESSPLNEDNVKDENMRQPKPKRQRRVKVEEDCEAAQKTKEATICQFCSKQYSRISSLREHVLRVHEKRRPFICEHCGHSTATNKDLQMHIRIRHDDKIDPAEKLKFACTKCGITRGSKAQLKNHMARKHSDERNCICEHCGLAFKTRSNLREHARYMHDPKMQLKCQHAGCDRSFRWVIS